MRASVKPVIPWLRQRWSECCNLVAVGVRLWQRPAAARPDFLASETILTLTSAPFTRSDRSEDRVELRPKAPIRHISRASGKCFSNWSDITAPPMREIPSGKSECGFFKHRRISCESELPNRQASGNSKATTGTPPVWR